MGPIDRGRGRLRPGARGHYDFSDRMSSSLRVCVVVGFLLAIGGPAVAGPVSGKLELPPALERPPSATRGFLERVENPLAPPKKLSYAAHMLVVLEGGPPPEAPGQRVLELVGESFATRVFGVPVGSEVLIKNVSREPRTLTAVEDPKLVPGDPINPTGTKSFRVTEAKIYTIRDKEAAHLEAKLVVVPSAHVATVDEAGRFSIADVHEGSYKLRIFYKDAWLDGTTDVTVGKGKTEVNPKVPALAPVKK